MKWNNVEDFMNALEDRIEELESDAVTSSTSICSSELFSEDELLEFDAIKEEAFSVAADDDEALDLICSKLLELDYTDDEITQILDYEGL